MGRGGKKLYTNIEAKDVEIIQFFYCGMPATRIG
jgi:hypothetical protein